MAFSFVAMQGAYRNGPADARLRLSFALEPAQPAGRVSSPRTVAAWERDRTRDRSERSGPRREERGERNWGSSSDRQDRGPRRFERDERKPREFGYGEREDRPRRYGSSEERPRRFGDDRPRRYGDERPRQFGRDDDERRPSRYGDDRQRRFGRDDERRPSRFSDRPPRRDASQGSWSRPGTRTERQRPVWATGSSDVLYLGSEGIPAGVIEYTSNASSERSGKLVSVLSKAQIGSTEVVELLVANGRVHVNGVPVTDVAALVEPTDRITVNGEFVEPESDEPELFYDEDEGDDDWEPRQRGKLPREYTSSIDGGFFKRKLDEIKNKDSW